jgi:hypothetical protein
MVDTIQQVLEAIALHLRENGIAATPEFSATHGWRWVTAAYRHNNSDYYVNITIVNGGIRIGGQGVNYSIPLAEPDSLNRLVRFIKSGFSWEQG